SKLINDYLQQMQLITADEFLRDQSQGENDHSPEIQMEIGKNKTSYKEVSRRDNFATELRDDFSKGIQYN
ncbi:hypothetical protein HHI36_010803, partial [Cryptolaemus montrouzieri]